MLVVDASAVIDLLLNRGPAAIVRDRIFRAGEELHAPHLIDIEVLHVIRRYNLMGEIQTDRAEQGIAVYRTLSIERHSHEVVLHRIWQLRAKLTAYDAAYVALAELLNAPLVTTDARLAGSPAARTVAELIQ